LHPRREPPETLDRIRRTIGEYNFASGEIVALTTIDGAVKALDLDRLDCIEADIEGWSCDCCTVPRAPSDVSGRACYWRSPAARRRVCRPDRFHSSTRCRSPSGKAIEVTLRCHIAFPHQDLRLRGMRKGEIGVGCDGAVKGLDRAWVKGQRQFAALDVGVARRPRDSAQNQVVSVCWHIAYSRALLKI
jgi:hypothetical protein